MLVFGRITPGGLAKDAVGRIPLVDEKRIPLTVTFPASSRARELHTSLFAEGSSGWWRPMDLTNFLKNVDDYLR